MSLSRAAIGIGLLTLAAATSCARYPSMVSYAAAEQEYRAEFYATRDTLAVRFTQPGLMALVLYPPRTEGGRVVINAGQASSGARGEALRCFDVSALAPPGGWTARLFWRNRDDALVPVRVVEGEAAERAVGACRAREAAGPRG